MMMAPLLHCCSPVNQVIPASASLSDPYAVYSNSTGLASLQAQVTVGIAHMFVPALMPLLDDGDRSPAPRDKRDDDAVMKPPAVPAARTPFTDDRGLGSSGGVLVPPMPASNAGFVSGLPASNTTDPLFMGGVHGGGLLVGPHNAMFGGDGDDYGGQFIGPDGLPVGVPPGGRFDPFGPPGMFPGLGGDGAGRGRGRGRGGLMPFGM